MSRQVYCTACWCGSTSRRTTRCWPAGHSACDDSLIHPPQAIVDYLSVATLSARCRGPRPSTRICVIHALVHTIHVKKQYLCSTRVSAYDTREETDEKNAPADLVAVRVAHADEDARRRRKVVPVILRADRSRRRSSVQRHRTQLRRIGHHALPKVHARTPCSQNMIKQ